MKKFIITVDTESDNQWSRSSELTVENAKFLPRFQDLCEKYGFKPVYLLDYSMASNDELVDYLKIKLKSNLCEIGAHPHAWDIPPFYDIDRSTNEKPYLIEYPSEVIREKLEKLTFLLEKRFEIKILSHRAGRWATNEFYFDILGDLGYKIDCSITPGIDWSKHKGYKSGGSNYKLSDSKPTFIDSSKRLLSVPMSIRLIKINDINFKNFKSFIISLIHLFFGKYVWLRLSISSKYEIKKLIEVIKQEGSDYIQFMIHSSELMPNGSPYYKTPESIENLYSDLEYIFKYISNSYQGVTLTEYFNMKGYM